MGVEGWSLIDLWRTEPDSLRMRDWCWDLHNEMTQAWKDPEEGTVRLREQQEQREVGDEVSEQAWVYQSSQSLFQQYRKSPLTFWMLFFFFSLKDKSIIIIFSPNFFPASASCLISAPSPNTLLLPPQTHAYAHGDTQLLTMQGLQRENEVPSSKP